MAKLECSAVVEDDEERNLLMKWVRDSKFQGYSDMNKTISVTYVEDPDDPDKSIKTWAIIRLFEQYPIHSIHQS